MSAVSSPYGFKPVNLIGGLPYAGSTRNVPIASGYATNIYNGSLVFVATAGVLQIATATGADATTNGMPVGTANTGCLGVFVGCSYTNPSTKQKIWSQYWPSGTVASDAVGIVVDDPNCIFQVQANGTLVQADMGANVILAAVQSTSTGNTNTGNSTTAVSATSQTTTGVFRVMGFVDAVGFSSVGDAFTDVLVKFNPGYHSYSNAVGL
jgi:hypothetical protein